MGSTIGFTLSLARARVRVRISSRELDGFFKRARPATGAFLLARPSVAASLNLECASPSQRQGGDLAGERTSGRKPLNSRQHHVSAGS
jgi:hypothetical protein